MSEEKEVLTLDDQILKVMSEADDSDEAFDNTVFPKWKGGFRPRLTPKEWQAKRDAGEEMGGGYIEYHPEEMAKHLLEQRGYVTRVARVMGVSPHTVHRAIKQWPICKVAVDTARERRKDRVEQTMHNRIENGSDRLIEFYLRTQAKDRGYSERPQFGTGEGGGIQIVYVNNWRGGSDESDIIDGEIEPTQGELLEDGSE